MSEQPNSTHSSNAEKENSPPHIQQSQAESVSAVAKDTLDAITTVEKPWASAKKVLVVIKELPITSLWSLILMVGGVLIFSFFASIEFMPEIDVKAALTLVAATAMLGIIIVVGMGGMLIVPAIVIKISQDSTKRQAIFLQYLIEAAVGIFLASAFLFWFFNTSSKESNQFDTQLIWAVLLLGVAVGFALHRMFRFYWINGKDVFDKKELGVKVVEIGFRIALWVFWAIFIGVFSIFLLRDANAFSIFTTVVFLPLAVATLSLVTASFSPKARLIAIPLLMILSFFLQAIFTQQFSWVAHSTMRLLGQSLPHKQTQLVVTEAGCMTINAQIQMSTETEKMSASNSIACMFDEKIKHGIVPSVRIVSRIGGHFVLDFDTQEKDRTEASSDAKKKARRVTLRSSEVTSWSYRVQVTHNKM
jgi:MFS family permease